MRAALLWAWWAVIQVASLVLTLTGLGIVPFLALCRAWNPRDTDVKSWSNAVAGDHVRYDWRGGLLTYLWGNDEDGIFGPAYVRVGGWRDSLQALVWSALRNPCNNLRFVPGVSGKGRPLFRRFFGHGTWYIQFGWNEGGYPVLSGGAN